MTTKSADGKFIISASEVGAFTVCPEAWRLKEVARMKASASARTEVGKDLHSAWTKAEDEVLYLLHRVRFVLWLILLAGCFMLLR